MPKVTAVVGSYLCVCVTALWPAAARELDASEASLNEPDLEAEILELAAPLDREALVAAVLNRNKAIEAARRAWLASAEVPSQARGLQNPRLSYSFAPQSVGSDSVRYGQRIDFSQRLPYPGKRRLQREVAEAVAAAAGHDLEAIRLSLATVSSLLYDDYYVVERAIEINDEHIELLASFQRIATARYAAGEESQQAPLQAEVEAAHLLHEGVLLETERAILVARINTLLHRSPSEWLPPPPKELAPPAARKAEERSLEEEAIATRPEIQSVTSTLEARRLEIELTERAFRPDFEVMGSYSTMWNQSEHRAMVGAGINLPIYRSKLRAAKAEAEALLGAIESEREVLIDRVRAEVAIVALLLEEAEHVLTLFRSRLLPAAADQTSAALAGFRTGQNSFLSLIEAERNQRTVRLDYERARADVHRRLAELDGALGRSPDAECRDQPSEGDQP